MIKSRKQMFVVIGAFALVMLLGTVTFAFFNYTRTGTANTISVGRIAFNTEQGDTVTLSDLFPIENTGNITSSTPGVGTLSIHVTGDTTYESGIEYIVKAVNVTSVATGNELPISISISYEANGQGKTVGEADDDYFTNRGGNTSIYKLLSTDTIENDGNILVGYIASGETGIDGNIVINAYLDANNIAITDTIEDGAIEVPGYTNGTDSNWINNRTVFTTEEWNALQANGVSFQIKIEANEGVWVEAPPRPAYQVINAVSGLEEVAGAKRYVGADPDNYVWFNNEQWRIIGVYGNNLKIIRANPLNSFEIWHTNGTITTWSGSRMQSAFLYGEYYPTLLESAREMIEENAIWNVGRCHYNNNASAAYTCASSTTWQGKIGLIASYEYLYAAENDGACWTTSGLYYGYDEECYLKDWLYYSTTGNGAHRAWTLTLHNSSSTVLYIDNYEPGTVYNKSPDAVNRVSPVVYLKSDVVITGGNGQIGETNSYKLG